MNNFIDIDLSNENGSILSEPIALFFQEIGIAVRLGPGEIWGVYETVDLKKYLFNQYITKQQIKNQLNNFIINNCQHSSEFEFEVDVQFLKIESKELLYIVLTVYDLDGSPYLQKFMLGE